jgi:hypothetical protein
VFTIRRRNKNTRATRKNGQSLGCFHFEKEHFETTFQMSNLFLNCDELHNKSQALETKTASISEGYQRVYCFVVQFLLTKIQSIVFTSPLFGELVKVSSWIIKSFPSLLANIAGSVKNSSKRIMRKLC